jgi:hypothetical protein
VEEVGGQRRNAARRHLTGRRLGGNRTSRTDCGTFAAQHIASDARHRTRKLRLQSRHPALMKTLRLKVVKPPTKLLLLKDRLKELGVQGTVGMTQAAEARTAWTQAKFTLQNNRRNIHTSCTLMIHARIQTYTCILVSELQLTVCSRRS